VLNGLNIVGVSIDVEDITDLEIHLLNFRDESLFDELL
jgi:hypothetical protein